MTSSSAQHDSVHLHRSTDASKLDMLISHYHSIDVQLRQEIEADRDVDVIQFLDNQLQEIWGRLQSYRATTNHEAYQHLMFFLGLEANPSAQMALSPCSAQPVDTLAIAELLKDYVLPEAIAPASLIGCDLPSIIDESSNRISLINCDFQYKYTSHSNAANYGCSTEEICGKHVAQIIGNDRFHRRAKGFFERCFDGETVEYAHALEDGSDVTSFLKCRMQPHYDRSNTLQGAIVTMTDISQELLLDVDQFKLVPLAT